MRGKEPARHLQDTDTFEDVLNSRMIASPFTLLQCCLVTDGGGTLTLVAAERAREALIFGEICRPRSSIGAYCHWLPEPTRQNHLVADGIEITGSLPVTLDRVIIARR